MRNLFVLLAASVLMVACGARQNTSTTSEETQVVMSVEELLANAPELVDAEVTVTGTVSHVCQHGGQRCFLIGASDETMIRIEAGEEIGAFSQENVGDNLQVTGVLRLVPITEEYVANLDSTDSHDEHHALGYHGSGQVVPEAEAEALKKEQTEELKSQIENSEEGFVPVFFIEGLKYTVVEEAETTPDGEGA